MALKYEALKVGDVLYDTYKERMGNTMMKTLRIVQVKILELYPEEQAALAQWGNRPPTKWRKAKLQALRRTKPATRELLTGQVVMLSKKEVKEDARLELIRQQRMKDNWGG